MKHGRNMEATFGGANLLEKPQTTPRGFWQNSTEAWLRSGSSKSQVSNHPSVHELLGLKQVGTRDVKKKT